MNKFGGLLLACDFDDTLVDETKEVTSGTVAALKYFTGGGGLFTVATGRDLHSFTMKKRDLPVNVPAVLANGSLIYDFSAGRTVFEQRLDDSCLEDMKKIMSEYPEISFEVYSGAEIFVYNLGTATLAHLKRTGEQYVQCAPGDMPLPWRRITIACGESLNHKILGRLRELFSEKYDTALANSVIDITAKNTNKGTSVLRVAEAFGISRENICCAGDSENDLPMLAVAGRPFVPKTAQPQLLKKGFPLTGGAGEACISGIIEQLERTYRQGVNSKR